MNYSNLTAEQKARHIELVKRAAAFGLSTDEFEEKRQLENLSREVR